MKTKLKIFLLVLTVTYSSLSLAQKNTSNSHCTEFLKFVEDVATDRFKGDPEVVPLRKAIAKFTTKEELDAEDVFIYTIYHTPEFNGKSPKDIVNFFEITCK